MPLSSDIHLLSGFANCADAAVYRLTDDLAIVQTVDYITPIVDDPFAFGAIAAANALSDLYAMGARPVLGLNLVGYPIKTLTLGTLNEILRGGAAKLTEAGASLGGGHSIEDLEPKYGMAVTGLIHPDHLVTNAHAQPGDVLVLTKPLGTGIITTGIDRGLAGEASVKRVTDMMTQLNREASEAMVSAGAHACTDVSGFGLLGHLREMVDASGVGALVRLDQVPVLSDAWDLAGKDVAPEGTRNNFRYLLEFAAYDREVSSDAQMILCDAQTSGGLLIALPPENAGELLNSLRQKGIQSAEIIGEIVPEHSGHIRVMKS